MKKKIKNLFLCMVLLLSSACHQTAQISHTSTVLFALDTVITTDIYGDQAMNTADQLETLVRDMEHSLSRTLPDSPVYALNHQIKEQNDEILALIREAFRYNTMTEGAFDITIAPVADLWGFTRDEFRIPGQNEITEALTHVGMDHIHIENDRIILDPGTAIDLGGIAKGLAVEQAYALFKRNNILSGTASFGGDISIYGSKPDGKPWRIGIQDPLDPQNNGHSAATVSLSDSYILTSGNYQRYFMQDGIRYHHIIDPHTGIPAMNELMSVTIIAPAEKSRGILCDALSTGLFILGKEKAIDCWKNHSDLFQMILITSDQQIFYTEGLQDIIEFPVSSPYQNIVIR